MTAEVEGVEINNAISLPQLRFVQSTDWREDARCASLPKDVFFSYSDSNKGGPRNQREIRVRKARAVCRLCPVIDKCYEFAVKNNEPHGIWAGTLPEQRKYLYKRFRKTGILESLPKF